MDVFHLIAHEGAYCIDFFFRYFKDQFVVDLQCHARLQSLFAQSGIDADHGDLDKVRGRALQRRVYGSALGKTTLIGVFAVDVGDGAHAAE